MLIAVEPLPDTVSSCCPVAESVPRAKPEADEKDDSARVWAPPAVELLVELEVEEPEPVVLEPLVVDVVPELLVDPDDVEPPEPSWDWRSAIAVR